MIEATMVMRAIRALCPCQASKPIKKFSVTLSVCSGGWQVGCPCGRKGDQSQDREEAAESFLRSIGEIKNKG